VNAKEKRGLTVVGGREIFSIVNVRMDRKGWGKVGVNV